MGTPFEVLFSFEVGFVCFGKGADLPGHPDPECRKTIYHGYPERINSFIQRMFDTEFPPGI